GFGKGGCGVGVGVVGDDVALAGDQVDEPFEGGLDRVQVCEYSRVVELDRGKDDRLGKVVKELGAFIEEGGVVLVAFQDEVFSLAQRKTAPEIFRDSAYQKRRVLAG